MRAAMFTRAFEIGFGWRHRLNYFHPRRGQQTKRNKNYLAAEKFGKACSEALRFGMVEPKGFEPLTPTMPLWCSTN